jgi:hypothetical protein
MAPTDEHAIRHRLYVAASNAIDLISIAGGWLADRALAGWDVTGFIANHHDGRPLRILGVDAVQFQSARDLRDRYAAHSLAVTPGLYQQDERIRTRVSRAITLGEPELIFLGDAYPPGLRGKPTKVQHQCSAAARAFKRHALEAAGGSADNVTEHEVFFSWPTSRISPADYATRSRTKSAARQPLEGTSRGWRGVSAPFA